MRTKVKHSKHNNGRNNILWMYTCTYIGQHKEANTNYTALSSLAFRRPPVFQVSSPLLAAAVFVLVCMQAIRGLAITQSKWFTSEPMYPSCVL